MERATVKTVEKKKKDYNGRVGIIVHYVSSKMRE